jgi:hypothetical protein
MLKALSKVQQVTENEEIDELEEEEDMDIVSQAKAAADKARAEANIAT